MWRLATRDFARRKRWYPIIALLVVCCVTTLVRAAAASQQDGSILRAAIQIDPAAAKVFPSAQFSSACAIISIGGLGPLSGEYALVNELTGINGTPVWIGTWADTRQFLLSWQNEERVWAIEQRGLSVPSFRAFVGGASNNVPPSKSSRWLVYSKSASVFEEVGNVVSIACPACTAVAISILPGTLAACEGPYRPRTANHKAGLLSWSHVNDERCEMLHDKAGHAWVTFGNPIATDGPGTAYAPPRREYWTSHAEAGGVAGSEEDGVNVVCTSAGQTTLLVFDMVGSREGIDSSPRAKLDSSDAPSFAPPSDVVRFVSPQDGSIISGSCNNVHLQVSRSKELRQAGIRQSEVSHAVQLTDETPCGTSLCVKITLSGRELLTTSFETMAIQGILLHYTSYEGTRVFELCLFEQDRGGPGESRLDRTRQGCIASAALTLEIFSAETSIVQRRSTSETILRPSVMGSEIEAEKDGAEDTRVLFFTDLGGVDGMKLSILHLMKHLPDTFQASTLDLSCASTDLPMLEMFTNEVGPVKRICIEVSAERGEADIPVTSFLHSVFSKATTWEGVVSDYPDLEQALGGLYRHLRGFDALVMSNGAKDADAYLLHLARIAGLKTRMVNLGAIAGGYTTPLYSGATSLIGPSHHIAHNPAVIRNPGGLQVKVCHPVMDAARVLKAAESCGSTGRASNEGMEPPRGSTDALSASRVEIERRNGSDDLQPTTFIMVGKMEGYKTPGMFVRAMSILQRRRRAEGKEQELGTLGVVVGRGPLRDHMETLARDLNASISFKGFLPVDDVPCEVQRATALVIPSISTETFGMVGPEAMLLGVPLVTFGFGGTGELVRHMENGMVVADPTPRALADALEVLANDPELRGRLGAQAQLDATRALSLPELVACHADELRIKQE